ncbi:efflux RND transporter periplasmic adaptor subunit [Robertkochia solimangrovi]|uniref:efflux RND transporter periplasmic adaptor subunit n=1 Tax=Robertkochia solimangrovi TaxID=2213046 RepID=UPI00117C08C0|nr:efflux RND transporter periplasmic adaptor subunit [Robertkochia solimangrovi]TRZ42154.1 efflux RND transporter periplasmic adaptor subunit [Robertkochia solimangrovi]
MKGKQKSRKLVYGGIGIIVLAAVAYIFLANDTEAPVTVSTVPVKKGSIATVVTATGTIEPLKTVSVGTQVSGEVSKLYADYNSVVKKGDLIAEIDKTNLLATLEQSKATYENALNELNYREGIYKRQKTLFEQEVISQADYDEANYNYLNAKSNVTQTKSDLQKARTNLSYATIYSPIDGVILSREVDEGQTVAASFEAPTLFTIAEDLSKMQVEANVDEADIGDVKEGQRVTFTVDAYPNSVFEGEVTQVRLDPTEEESVITYKVIIHAGNPEFKLKPGLTATVSIYTKELNDILTLEAKAMNFHPGTEMMNAYRLQEGLMTGNSSRPDDVGASPEAPSQEDQKMVWVMNADRMIHPTPVTTGVSDGINVEIKSGLEAGEQVVYDLSRNVEVSTDTGSGGSPFMPKPPGRNNDKSKSSK